MIGWKFDENTKTPAVGGTGDMFEDYYGSLPTWRGYDGGETGIRDAKQNNFG